MSRFQKVFRYSLFKNRIQFRRYFGEVKHEFLINRNSPRRVLYMIGGTVVFCTAIKFCTIKTVKTSKLREEPQTVELTTHEKIFLRFASMELDSQFYMTPQDFLESVVQEEPRPRLKRRFLTPQKLEEIKIVTPCINKGSYELFHKLGDKGIISYTEYLFLLASLMKSPSDFRIAFKMFDTDGNEKVDKNEFLVLEKIFSHAWRSKRGVFEKGKKDLDSAYNYIDEGLLKQNSIDTTLILHFFDTKGSSVLTFEKFKQFMIELQNEVLQLEFNEFSRGLPTISEVDFAKILLRYSELDPKKYDMYLNRLLNRIQDTKGISFEEFSVFCQFLRHLKDFTIAMRMYILVEHHISKDEFHRAVKICTGVNLSAHVVNIVFAIFDNDNDSLLSYSEFLEIMKDRLYRGLKSHNKMKGWEGFKTCLRKEVKNPK